jgi:hypothetical protein
MAIFNHESPNLGTTVIRASVNGDSPLKVENAEGTELLEVTHAGALEPSGNLTVASGKTLAVTTADKLTVGGVIVPQVLEVSAHIGAAGLMVDQTFFVANRAYTVTGARFVHATAETTAANLRVQITKDTGTNAPGAGTDLLTNNTNAGFDGKATANTVQTATLTATGASLALAAGDRLSLDFEAAATELAGVTITVSLKAT